MSTDCGQIAVAEVVAYHNFPQTAHGGFIGVDIFFRHMGFLITSILAREIDAGGIGFVGFYARRAQRFSRPSQSYCWRRSSWVRFC